MEISENDIKLIEVGRVLTEYKIRAEELIKRKVQDYDKIATGNLLASIRTSVELEGTTYSVYLNALKYLDYIEDGQRPHWTPTEPILKWVQDKKLPTKELYGGNLPTEKQLTYLVRRKIAEEGVAPVPLVAETIDDLNRQFIPRIQEALMTDIYSSMPMIVINLRFDINRGKDYKSRE